MGYVSKDFIHMGCGLPLEPERVWEEVPYSVRKNINKAERNDIKIEKASGTPDEIEILRRMWYDPDDPNMPRALGKRDHMFIARSKSGEPLGVCILLPVGNHLFLNNLAGNDEGKRLRVQDFLLWHAVNYFSDSEYKYIDVGVSYRHSLYNFFEKWGIVKYPVIFNPPELPVRISAFPFNPLTYYHHSDKNAEDSAFIKFAEMTGCRKITFAPAPAFAARIMEGEKFERIESTADFPEIPDDKPSFIDLRKIFHTQFGCLIFNLDISDPTMWNKYQCLDVFKRRAVLSELNEQLDYFDKIIEKREYNYNYLKEKFALDDIAPVEDVPNVPMWFAFRHEFAEKYANKLDEFEVDYQHGSKSDMIRLPVHQNLTEQHLDYMYGIFRGVLNLCSEWEHTDVYEEYKDQ
jgi:hypothetical protein